MLLSEFDMQIMQVVKLIRNYKCIKQSQIAAALQIDRTSYSKMENGTNSFTPSQLELIATELQIQPSAILDFVRDNQGTKNDTEHFIQKAIQHFSLENIQR